ncbi:MAG TPA: ABC transporter substrate-binding protein [Acidimicrobiia bacterium]|nr:ABC transporter substrate-binding protein [Acidimicrobiia bacterium]
MRSSRIVALAAVAAIALAGCGGGSDHKTTGALPASPGQPATEAAAPADAPQPTADNATGTPGAPAPDASAPASPTPTAAQAPSAAKGTTTGGPKAAAGTASSPSAGGSSAPVAQHANGPSSTPAIATPGAPAPAYDAKAGNGGATDRGVSADEVKFGGIMMYGWLGLSEQVWQPMTRQMRALFKIVNDNGGIYGRKMTYIDCDDGPGDPARTRACYKKLVDQDKIFAFSAGCSLSEDQYQADLKKDQIPAFAPCSLYQVEWANPYSFPIHMDMRQEGTATANWAMDTKKPKTYGVLCLNIPDSQAACSRVEKRMNAAGVKEVFKRTYRSGTPDMSGDVLAARTAAPDMIFDYAIDAFVSARFYIDSQQQDYWPPMGIISNHKTIEPLGGIIGDFPAKKGYWNNTTYLLWGPEHIAWQRKYVPENKGESHHVLQGQWVGEQAMLECMKRIGPNLTRVGVMECMNSQRWETPPGLGQSMMWSAGNRYSDDTINRKEFVYKYVSTETYSGDDGKTKGWIPDPGEFVAHAPAPEAGE